MGRKKFRLRDAISLGIQAAGVAGSVASAQAAANKAAGEAAKAGQAGEAAKKLADKSNTYKIAEAAKPKVDKGSFNSAFADQRPAAQGGQSSVKPNAQARLNNKVNRSPLVQDQLKRRRFD